MRTRRTRLSVVACCVASHIIPEIMASFAHKLIDSLYGLTPSASSAIPVLELLSDTSDIHQFHKFFDEKQFSSVMSVIGNYGNVNKFSPFVISSMQRTAMRWYIRAPEAKRTAIKDSLNRKIEQVLSTPYTVLSGEAILNSNQVSRQPSGDGRQVSGALFTLGAQPETPPIVESSAAAITKSEKILSEVRHVMESFFKSPVILEVQGDADFPPSLREASHEYYYLNDTIISVRTLVDGKILDREDSYDNVFMESGKAEIGFTTPQQSPSFLEQRRRNASAVQGASNRRGAVVNGEKRAVDDCLATTQASHFPPRQRITSLSRMPAITFTQMIVRHAHGKTCWTMRSLDEWPEDFEKTSSIPPPASSLLHHLSTMNGAVKLGQKGKEEDLQRSIRILDTLPAMDLHQVGVLYMGPYQSEQKEILSNIYGSECYNRFVKDLGEPFSLDSEMRNTGLILGKHGTYSYNYMDELSHIIYAVGTLMPNLEEDPNFNQKTKIIGNNEVCIVWNESGVNFKYGMLFKKFQQSAVEIVPYGLNHVLVQIHAKKEVCEWMAMKRVLLPIGRAPSVVRKLTQRLSVASIMHNHETRSSGSENDLPFISHAILRLRKISDIKERNAER
ncbi:hypothetical protein WR25_21838 [Diploscapter pachys]|uniref:Rap-GAP domain-containing protein n=1 Tax=Diploscapter pachys TaxID=2018661 RepID=A0A2A2LQN8_9BILA|nr:hypothetical protein WR25_21838 [Diploscapter pachys]